MSALPILGQDILKLIPQRKPIIMVDSLLEYSESDILSELTVVADNIFVFESYLQESGLLEHMAQTVAMHTGYSFFIREEQAPKGYIGSIQKAEIIRLPKNGEKIQSRAEIVQEFMGVTLVNITSYIGDQVIATSQMKTVIAST